ncbi:poly [ADP-ribose] polymerase 11-like [Anoplophora glabripennis]|uniref:poly [ADP-ribose] polymerase 11-like n=1 Tax=Anoplophora glabripennis TaxID=217634 RepID=UPI000C789D7E|nr:poly [ADP-ribose] polymerase 11-like [Anoplophora glabripennis]
MDSVILEFNKLTVSKKKRSKTQVKVTQLHIPGPIRVSIDPNILKINNKFTLSNEGDCYEVNNVLTYINLHKDNAQFKDIKKLFAKSNMFVKSVKKVHNPYLQKAFELKRNMQYGNKQPRRLFHGTKEKYVDNICTYNFDWRLGGTEKGHRHGKGVNFSQSAHFATFFCDKKRRRVIILADVLIDEVRPGNINTLVPPRGSDTTSGKNGMIFVKFYDNEFYPKYVIHFDMIYLKK